MDNEEEPVCRICAEDAHYNIFQDELVINNKNMKIYIVLNNFIFEKLYGPDEFSNSICLKCCDILFNSYKFMLKVRDSEQKLRTEGPPQPKRQRIQVEEEQINEELSLGDVQDDLTNEPILNDDILDGEFSEEDIVNASIKEEKKSQQHLIEFKTETVKKKPLQVSSSEPIDAITITEYSLAFKEENDQIIANIHIDSGTIHNSGNGNYDLDKWLENSSESAIYSCTYCVKGFSNCDFLLKHLTSSHVCITCFKICDNNKLLNQHMKVHNEEKLVCPFCGKVCTYNVYRQHIRKQHVLNLPYYVGILPHNLEVGNV